MELCALDAEDGETWLSAIQAGIVFAEQAKQEEEDHAGSSSVVSPSGQAKDKNEAVDGQGGQEKAVNGSLANADAAQSVQEWLDRLGCAELWPLFERKGYVDLPSIRRRGLQAADLDKIGVLNPMKRRFLLTVNRSPFRTHLHITVHGHREFSGGDVVLLQLSCEWRAWSCRTEKLYTDIRKLHNKMLRLVQEQEQQDQQDRKEQLEYQQEHQDEQLLQVATNPDSDSDRITNSLRAEDLPLLPGKDIVAQRQADPAYLALLRQSVEAYLQGLAKVVGEREPFFTALCSALDLRPGGGGR